MAENTGIEWAHHTFNPWTGCTKVSAACDFCYAEAWSKRSGHVEWGPHGSRRRTKTWGNPIKWNRQAEAEGVRYRVFCASLADVFDNHKSILPEWRIDLWDLIEATPNLDWLLLTKRPQNIERYLPDDWGAGYPNVWLGTTVENQEEAERRIPHLLRVSAKVHFLSCEPLLGPVDLTICTTNPMAMGWPNNAGDFPQGTYNTLQGSWWPAIGDAAQEYHLREEECPTINWVITGGESGPNYRPANPDWFRILRDQCAAAGVPFLFKQWEGKTQAQIKAMGRELDGVVHDGYPQSGGAS